MMTLDTRVTMTKSRRLSWTAGMDELAIVEDRMVVDGFAADAVAGRVMRAEAAILSTPCVTVEDAALRLRIALVTAERLLPLGEKLGEEWKPVREAADALDALSDKCGADFRS